MNTAIKSITTLSALSLVTVISATVGAHSAIAQPLQATSAQPMGLSSSYLGAGVSVGVTNGGQGNDHAVVGGQLQGRVPINTAPLSVRGAALITDKSAALVPMISYDVPVAQNTNLYAGVGYSFVTNQSAPTPLGNRNAVVLTTGVESEIARNVVAYGDIKFGVNAYQNSPANAVSLQAGIGYRF